MITLGPHHDGEDAELSFATFPEYRSKGYWKYKLDEDSPPSTEYNPPVT